MTGGPASLAGRPAGHPAGGPPAASRQPLSGLAEARWVLANFGGLFWAFWGPFFNPKEVETQVRHTVNQTKEIWDKTGLRFDQSEFSKLGCQKRSKSEKRLPKNGTAVLFSSNSQVELLGILFRHSAIAFRRPKIIADQNGVFTPSNITK